MPIVLHTDPADRELTLKTARTIARKKVLAGKDPLTARQEAVEGCFFEAPLARFVGCGAMTDWIERQQEANKLTGKVRWEDDMTTTHNRKTKIDAKTTHARPGHLIGKGDLYPTTVYVLAHPLTGFEELELTGSGSYEAIGWKLGKDMHPLEGALEGLIGCRADELEPMETLVSYVQRA